VACDPGRQRVYVGNAGGDSVSIVDVGQHAQSVTVHLGGLGHPHDLAFDPIRDRLYVTYALSPKYRAVAVIDGSSGQILSRLRGDEKRPLFAAYGLVVDPLSGWLHVATADQVLTLAGDTLSVVGTVPRVGPAYAFGLCLSPLGDRLYVADAQFGRVALVRQPCEEANGCD
jgi:YVTN family beta-propeller protein